MENENYINTIIEYFRELKDLWQTKHKETINDKIHNHTKYTSSISLIMTFILIVLTLTGILLTSFNATSQDLSKLTESLSSLNVPNATEEIKSLQLNLTISEIEFKSTSIETTYGIIKIIMYGFFLTLLILFFLNLLSAFSESRYYKRLKESEDDIIMLEEIITALYSIKIRLHNKLKDKDIRKELLLFDRIEFLDYKKVLLRLIKQNE